MVQSKYRLSSSGDTTKPTGDSGLESECSLKRAKVSMARLNFVSKNFHNSCASFDKCQKFDGGCPPTQTPTQKIKSRFTIFSSQENDPSLVSLKMIFETLQSELFRI